MRNRLSRGIVIGLVVTVAVAAAACSSMDLFGDGNGGAGTASGTAIRPTWVTPVVDGSNASIPASDVESGKMLHFTLPTQQGYKLNFMAYELGGESYVRANVCPPCRSIGFSLKGDTLVCNSCGTTFKAATGGGIGGPCRDYPKAEVAHYKDGTNIVMETAAMGAAYQNTQKRGWP